MIISFLFLISFCIVHCNCCPAGYILCANENQICSASGVIAFGNDTRYAYKKITGSSVNCTTKRFGDPIIGHTKECCKQNVTITGTPNASPHIVGIISCEETVYSFFKNWNEIHYWKLTTANSNNITYTTCNSSFDTTLNVYNDEDNLISSPYCISASPHEGDNCNEDQCFSNSNNELFTIPSQLPGTYYIDISSEDGDAMGQYQLYVSCSSPIHSPTNVPTAPTYIPTFAPTHDPSIAPTDSTSSPTYNPSADTKSPTKYPTNYPSWIPTRNPTLSPNEPLNINPVDRPTSSPTMMIYTDLLFVCYYDGVDKYIINDYVDLLKNQTLSTFDVISSPSWSGSGIINFEICRVFTDTMFSHKCNDYGYQISSKIYADYVTTASFGITTHSSINEYKKYLIDTMESDQFKHALTNNMNNALDDIDNSRRRRRNLLDVNNFGIVYIEVIDTQNYTNLTEKATNKKETKSDQHVIIVVIIVTVIFCLVLICIVFAIYFYRKRENQKTKDGMSNEVEMKQQKEKCLESDGKIEHEKEDGENMDVDDNMNDDEDDLIYEAPVEGHNDTTVTGQGMEEDTNNNNNNNEERDDMDELYVDNNDVVLPPIPVEPIDDKNDNTPGLSEIDAMEMEKKVIKKVDSLDDLYEPTEDNTPGNTKNNQETVMENK